MVLYNSISSLILSCSFFMVVSFLPHGTALNFNLVNISPKNLNVDLTVEKDAYVSIQGIEVTSDEFNVNRAQKAGRAMYIEPLHLWDKASGKVTDFDTHFLFVIDSEKNAIFGDGIAFFLIPPGDSNITVGGAMGLPIDPTTYHWTSPFVAVEFDTYNNPDVDPENVETHVGIDVNSFISNATAVWENNIFFGSENEAWITYNSSSKNLSVVFTSFKNATRFLQDLNLIVDLKEYLPEWVRIGFSASTGALFERHNVRSWQFNSSLQIAEKTSSGQDSNESSHEVNKGGRNIIGIVVGSSIGLSFLLLGW